MLDLAKEAREQQLSPHHSLIEYGKIWPLVKSHTLQAQRGQAKVYNRNAQIREFQPGELVLVLVPKAKCKFLAKWHGPYEVVGVIKESHSAWSSPIVLTPTDRFCNDLRKLNEISKFDTYPVHRLMS